MSEISAEQLQRYYVPGKALGLVASTRNTATQNVMSATVVCITEN